MSGETRLVIGMTLVGVVFAAALICLGVVALLGHNAERGAAGASLLNAELARARGLLAAAVAADPHRPR